MAGGRGKQKRAKGPSGPASSASVARAPTHEPRPAAPGHGPRPPVAAEPRSFVDAPLAGTTQRAALAVLCVWTIIQLAIPLRYYLGDDLYDERFAWRMFSAVRVQECEIAVAETRDGREVALQPMTFLPAPWVGLLERSRPAVVRGFLDWRCEGLDASAADAPDVVSVRSSCVDATGDPIPSVVRALTCEGRQYEERTDAAPDAEDAP